MGRPRTRADQACMARGSRLPLVRDAQSRHRRERWPLYRVPRRRLHRAAELRRRASAPRRARLVCHRHPHPVVPAHDRPRLPRAARTRIMAVLELDAASRARPPQPLRPAAGASARPAAQADGAALARRARQQHGVLARRSRKVDGFDAAFTGWGREDSDIFIRLIRAGIRRKDGRFASGVLHLWHPEADRTHLEGNERQLEEVLHSARIAARSGLSRLSKTRPQAGEEGPVALGAGVGDRRP